MKGGVIMNNPKSKKESTREYCKNTATRAERLAWQEVAYIERLKRVYVTTYELFGVRIPELKRELHRYRKYNDELKRQKHLENKQHSEN